MAGNSRSVVARLTIDGVQGVITGFKRVHEAAQEYGRVAQGAGKQAWQFIRKHADELDKIGTKLVGLGAVGVASMGLLAKAAIDWESAWAGVTKTVDGTPEQMAALEEQLRGLAKTLPATHEEIAAVAEAAGQLGVGVEDVAAFTKTMIDLGETTNLGAEEAATTLQRFMNIMGTSTSDVSRLGSAVVGLGNSFATTEAEIAHMAQRIAGVGAQMGLTEGDVLGMAAAMSSVGIEAEAGGTAISMTMKRIDAAVRDDGEQLLAWAELAGVSADEFATLWREDAAGAMASVTEGLGRVVASGRSASGVLDDLGVKGIRESDVMNRLALATEAAGGQQNMLREAVAMANDEWAKNSALTAEAEQRYQTTAAQAQMTLNSIKDESINLGQSLLPVVDQVLGFVNSMVDAWGQVPAGVQDWALGILGISSAAAIAAGTVVKLAAGAAKLQTSLATLGVSMRTATLSMGALGVALAIGGGLLAHWMTQQAEAKDRVEALTNAIKEQQGLYTEVTRMTAGQQLIDSGLADEAERYGIAIGDLIDAMMGIPDAQARVDAATEAHVQGIRDEIDARKEQGLAIGTLGESLQVAEARQKRFNDALGEHQGEFQQSADAWQRHQELAEASADATDEAAEAAKRNAAAQQAQAEAYAEVEQELSELIELTQAYGHALLELSGSEIAVEKSIANLNDRLKELKEGGEGNARTLDLQTESGRANQEALDSLARASMAYVETLAEQGASAEEIAAETERAREAWIDARVAMGDTEESARDLADAYFAIPDTAVTEASLTGDDKAKRQIKQLKDEIDKLPPDKRTRFQAMLDQGKYNEVARQLEYLARARIMTIQVQQRGVDPRVHSLYEADGGVVDYYARGGIRERHVAQIAPAGAMRVWAEPETGGEAYIPLAAAKRRRSLEIWRETGRRLGVAGYASGAVVAPGSPSVSSPPIPREDHFHFHGTDPVAVGQQVYAKVAHERQKEAVER